MDFADLIKQTGFKELEKNESFLIGDLLLFINEYNKFSHIGIYIGDQMMIHHEIRKLSCRELYGKNWIDCTAKRFRYA